MRRPLLVLWVAVCIAMASWLYYQHVLKRELLLARQTREALVKLQHAEQRLQAIESGRDHPLLGVLGEDVAALQVRLAEFLTAASYRHGGMIAAYEQWLMPDTVSAQDSVVGDSLDDIKVLRLDVRAQLLHSLAVLDLIRDIQKAAGGWPTDVRACELSRLPLEKLSARCVLDIYYWTVDIST